jgi:hypothetical protein
MTTIWKATLQPLDMQSIMVPAGAEILCAREQFDRICIWYRCDPSAQLSPRNITVVGTGHPSHNIDGRYLGTAMLGGGQLVFHIFEQADLVSRAVIG